MKQLEDISCACGNYGGRRAFWEDIRSKWGPTSL